MRTHLLAAAACLLAAAARADDPDPRLYAPPRADTSATVYACTVETLISGRDCVFEGQAPPALEAVRQARENGRAAASLADRACGRAARLATESRPDGAVLSACRRDFGERAAGCAADGSAPLLDAEGRFGAGARACYAAMSQVLARTRLMASATGACCRCLAASGCVRSGEQCNRALARGAGAPSACMARSCAESCGAFLPAEPPPGPPPGRKAALPLDRSAEPRNL
ncbi:MAG TPA: hypothetical protein VH880_04430 [Anaeromyxobacteraceae bacterium]